MNLNVYDQHKAIYKQNALNNNFFFTQKQATYVSIPKEIAHKIE